MLMLGRGMAPTVTGMAIILLMLMSNSPNAGAVALPDDRAYEMVSPPMKLGSEVAADSGRIHASSGGDALSFTSVGGFGDVRGTGVATEYMSVRDRGPGQGWSTHAITPPQMPMTYSAAVAALDPEYEGDFSEDLNTGVFGAYSPVTADANVSAVANVYLRRDLRTPGEGVYQLLSSCSLCGVLPSNVPLLSDTQYRPQFAGASRDFGHVVFEAHSAPVGATRALTADATEGRNNLYEWDHGALRAVGQIPAEPDTSCADPACVPAPGGSAAGRGAGHAASATRSYTPHVISESGERIVFISPLSFIGGASNSSKLYLRDRSGSAATTVQINVSETSLPSSPEAAFYQDASSDGSRIFFTTVERLADTAPPGGGTPHLYMYDVTPDQNGKHLTQLDVDEGAGGDGPVAGVVGASDDGTYVYFLAKDQLFSGPNGPPALNGNNALYLWHEGDLRYIGQATAFDEATDITGGIVQLAPHIARVTPDGRTLLFGATVDPTTGNPNGSCTTGTTGCRHLYIYSAETGVLRCASCSPSGVEPSTYAGDMVRTGGGASSTSAHLSHPLSDDGRRVFFDTGEALVPADANGTKADVYQYDVPAGTEPTGALHLVSSGTSDTDSRFLDATPSGEDVFFLTRERLVGWDVDNGNDVYDARVPHPDAGFAEPPVPPAVCAGDACQGGMLLPPSIAQPGSASFFGPPDVARLAKARSKPVCRKGRVRKRMRGRQRCVARGRRAHGKRFPKARRSAR